MKIIVVGITLCFFIVGCVTSSKTTRPTTCISKENSTALEEVGLQRCPFTAETVTVDKPITYSGITNVIDVFFEIQSKETGFGETKFLGSSDNALMNLEILGREEEVLEASLKLSYPKDIRNVDSDLNNAVMLRFLKNVSLGYKEWPKDVKGIMNKFSSMEIGKREKDRIVLGKRIIDVIYDKKIDTITLTVKSK